MNHLTLGFGTTAPIRSTGHFNCGHVDGSLTRSGDLACKSPPLSGTIGLNQGHGNGWIAQKGLAGASCPAALGKGGLLVENPEVRSFFTPDPDLARVDGERPGSPLPYPTGGGYRLTACKRSACIP